MTSGTTDDSAVCGGFMRGIVAGHEVATDNEITGEWTSTITGGTSGNNAAVAFAVAMH
jgi:hypothetical protein